MFLKQPSKAEEFIAWPDQTMIYPYCSCIRPVPDYTKDWSNAGRSHTFTLTAHCSKCGKKRV